MRSLWECGSQLLALHDALTRSVPAAAGAPPGAGSSQSLGQRRLVPLSSAAGRACNRAAASGAAQLGCGKGLQVLGQTRSC